MLECTRKRGKYHESLVSATKRNKNDRMKSIGSVSIRLGLDPAKPMFEDTSDNDSSLDKSDAEFVEYINFRTVTVIMLTFCN